METDENIPDYMGATGIREIAFEEIASTSVVTPYGAFPMFLASGTTHHCFLFGRTPSSEAPFERPMQHSMNTFTPTVTHECVWVV
jgi:hypothetical protein